MRDWTEWETLDHRVVLSGRVADTSDQPVGGMEIATECLSATAKSGSSGPAVKSAKGQRAAVRTARVKSRADGLYWFLDLPVGEYMLLLYREKSKVLQEEKISLSCDDKGIVRRKTVNFSID